MVNYDFILCGIFVVLLLIFYVKKRKEIQFQGIVALYRTKLGTIFSKKVVAKAPTFWKWFGYFSIFIGFLGMAFIFYTLLKGAINLLVNPQAAPMVAPVLPFIKIPGLPTLLFTYWIIGIFIVAAIHEFSHALLSVAHNIKIKSSGFAFFGPIPAAFVEPDEKQLAKKKVSQQLSVFAAGPTSNIVTGILFFLISGFLLAPAIVSIADVEFKIAVIEPDSPAEVIGLQEGMLIEKINNQKATLENVTTIIMEIKPFDIVTIESSGKSYPISTIEHPENKSKGFMGISLETHLEPKKQSSAFLLGSLLWIQVLFFWLFVFSIGIGLVNLLPLGPVDGGRMLFVVLGSFTKNTKVVNKLFIIISFISFLLIFINFWPWIEKLLLWLIGLF